MCHDVDLKSFSLQEIVGLWVVQVLVCGYYCDGGVVKMWKG